MPDGQNKSVVSPLVGYGLIGSEMAGFTVLGLGIDWAAGTTPWATVFLTLFGFVAAFVHLTRMVRKSPGNDQKSV